MKKIRYSNYIATAGFALMLLITAGCQQDAALTAKAAVDPDAAARHYIQSGHFEQAVEPLKASVKARPNDARAWCNLGFVYIDLARFQDAVGPLKKAIALEPTLSEAHCNLGIAYIGLDRLPEATASLQEAIRLNPEYAEAQTKLGMTWMLRRQWDKAVAPLDLAVRLEPDSAITHFTLGAAYAKLGDRQAALKHYEILKTLDPAMAGRFLVELRKQEQLMASSTL